MDTNTRKKWKKKRRETAKDRFLKETKEYDDAKKLNLWKTERKIADEIMEAVTHFKLPYCLDRLTRYDINSFYTAVLQQMRRKEIYSSLDEENQRIADSMDLHILKRKICALMTKSENEEEIDDRIKRLRWSFANQKMLEKWGSWNNYWEKMDIQFSQDGITEFFANDWQIKATSIYLNRDIAVVRIRSPNVDDGTIWLGDEDAPMRAEYFSKDLGFLFEVDNSKALIIGLKTNIHYQSLLVSNCHQLEDVPSTSHPKNTSNCPNCDKSYVQLLKHISQTDCKNKVDQNFIQELRDKTKSRNKEQNKVHKANSRKFIQFHESSKERESRLLKKREVMKKLRDKKVKENGKLVRDKEKSDKRKSRIKQKNENPNYENPPFKEKWDLYKRKQ